MALKVWFIFRKGFIAFPIEFLKLIKETHDYYFKNNKNSNIF